MLPRNYLLDYYVLYLPGGGAPSNSLHPYFTLTLINILLLLIIILLIIIAIAIACRFDAVLIVELCLCSLFFPASLFRLLHCGHIAAPLLRLHLYDSNVREGKEYTWSTCGVHVLQQHNRVHLNTLIRVHSPSAEYIQLIAG